MARRNGRTLARSVAAQLNRCVAKNPEQPMVDHWQEVLERRLGWRKVRQYLYEFRTGERLELKAKPDPTELVHWLATAELRPLTAGLPTSFREELLKESVTAALARWKSLER